VTTTLADITQRYQTSADFVAVYITEAHARNEWPAGSKLSICDQPTTRQERLIVANQLSESKQLCMPLLVDDIDNAFDHVFAAWPIRFYILQHGMIACKAQPSAFMNGYDFEEICNFLDAYLQSKSISAPSKTKKRGRDSSLSHDNE